LIQFELDFILMRDIDKIIGKGWKGKRLGWCTWDRFA